MKTFAIIALAIGLTAAGTISNYSPMSGGGSGSASSSYGGNGGGSGGSGGYGGGYEKPKCRDVYDTVQEDKCEPYTERVCQTTQKETCQDVADQNCRAITTTKQIRKCFDVTENKCSLKEQVKFDTVQVGFTVQKCRKVKERVCDTVYETQMTTKEDFQCLEIENPVCVNEERAIVDKTCRTTTQFDCKQTGGSSGYGSGSGSGYGSSGDNFGSGSASGGFGSGSSSGGYGGSSSSGGYGDDSQSGGYGQVEPPQVVCNRRQETKCYDTPRTVNVQRCTRKADKVCEKVTLLSPVAQERQNCRNEDKKVCELEERTQPKQVKNYVYTKQCNPVPRRVCENADVAQLVPSCVASTRKQCSYSPVEACEDTPKQHCFKVSRQVRRQVCEGASGSQGSSSQGLGGSNSFASAMGFGSSDSNDFSSGFASSGFGGSGSSSFGSGSHGVSSQGVSSSSSAAGGSIGFDGEY